MKILLLAGALTLALATGVVRDPHALAQPEPAFAQLIHTVR